MPSDKSLESASKLVAFLNEAGKLFAFLFLLVFVAGAFASPTFVKDRLDKLGLRINAFDLGWIKFVATETASASKGTVDVSEALTKAEIALASSTASPLSQTVQEALVSIRNAKLTMDEQTKALKNIGSATGARTVTPSSGWLYLGYYGEDMALRKASDRVAAEGLARLDMNLKRVVLAHDAPIISDGDNCTKVDVADMPAFDPNKKETEVAVVRASNEALQVLQVKDCASRGKGHLLYAQVHVPESRIRFAQLSTISNH
jgi:hypothetical protein